jgi:hypothetical protein
MTGHVDHVLRELGQRWGLGALDWDDRRAVRLCFDESCVVQLLEGDEGLWVSAAVGVWTGADDDTLAVRLLQANGPLQRAGIGALAIAEDSADIQLCHCVPSEHLTADALSPWLLRFVEAAQHWERALRTAH